MDLIAHFTRRLAYDGWANQEALATFQGNSFAVFRDTGVAMAAHTLGDARASQQALDRLIAAAAGDAAYQIAEVYAYRGQVDKSFEWLDRAYEQRDPGVPEIKTDPLLQNLRHDQRYSELLKRMRLPA